MTARAARRVVLALLGRLHTGELTVVEGRRRHVFGAGVPRATIEVHSERFWPALLHGSRGLAESYADGLWDSPDLPAPPAGRVQGAALRRTDAAGRSTAS